MTCKGLTATLHRAWQRTYCLLTRSCQAEIQVLARAASGLPLSGRRLPVLLLERCVGVVCMGAGGVFN